MRQFLFSVIFLFSVSAFGAEIPSGKPANFCRFFLGSLNVENAHPPYMTIPDRVAEYTPIKHLGSIRARGLAGSPNRRLPNWTREKVELKLGQLQTLLGLWPERPAVLGIVEVRDASITGKIATALGYKEPIVSASSNERGMDVGLLLNPSPELEIVSTQEVPLTGPEFANYRTRNLLVVSVSVAQRFLLHFVVAHWPSQGGPTEARVEAARQTRALVGKLKSDYPGSEAIVMGDFNTLDSEKDILGRHPFRDILLEANGAATLVDAFTLESMRAPGAHPEGTYYYAPNDEWNRLDRFFVTDGLLRNRPNGLRLVSKTYRVNAPEAVTHEVKRRDGSTIRVPLRYDPEATTAARAGFTDHFGISVGIEAHWQDSGLERVRFLLDQDILLARSVILFPKSPKGARRFISWSEYVAEKDKIGVDGAKFGAFEIREGESFVRLRDGDDGKNWYFNDLRYDSEGGDIEKIRGPRWDEFVAALATPESARRVLLHIPDYRTHRPESVYQLLLDLREKGIIAELPLLENIEQAPSTMPVDLAETKAK